MGGWNKICRVEKFQKINNRGGGDDYSEPESKGMLNIYLKVTIDRFSELRFSGFKKFVTMSILRSTNSRRYH